MRVQLSQARGAQPRIAASALGALIALCLLWLCAGQPASAQSERNPRGNAGLSQSLETKGERDGSLGSAFYVRTDSDKTVVITPSIHFRKSLGPNKRTGVSVGYLADVWTSASIDIRSAASKEVVEQRDEVVAGIDHERGMWILGAGFRHSYETDYRSNAISLSVKRDLFERNTSIEGRISGALDRVGRSGDARFQEDVRSASLWLGLTQVISKSMIAQLSGEGRISTGFLSSAYRYVPIGPGLQNCKSPSGFCLREAHPGTRARLALVGRLRYALTPKLSMGAGYRFYYDQWQLLSNTGTLDLAARVTKGLTLVADGRIYQQGDAFFYRSNYTLADLAEGDDAYITRDRELSALWNWRAGLRAEYESPLNSVGLGVKAGLMSSVTQYRYNDFPGLEKVTALELAGSVGVVF